MRAARRREAAVLAALVLFAGQVGCATTYGGRAIPATEAHRALLGRNPGLTALRGFAEVWISYGGRDVSLPGVLVLERLRGFRIDLLDPFDRPLAMIFADRGRIVQYRPAIDRASALTLFPEECRGLDPGLWAGALLASSTGPIDGVGERVRRTWSGDYLLERSRGAEVRQSILFRDDNGLLNPVRYSWYCAEEPVMTLRVYSWMRDPDWRIPSSFEVVYPNAGLRVRLELSEAETNPPLVGPLHPRPAPAARWLPWDLPQ